MLNGLIAIVVAVINLAMPKYDPLSRVDVGQIRHAMAPPDRAQAGVEADHPYLKLDPGLTHSKDTNRLIPFTLEIITVPPIQGIPFRVSGRRLETNAEGVIRSRIWREGLNEVEILMEDFQSSKYKLEFARWSDAVFLTKRDIDITSSLSIEAGFNVSYPVQLNYTNLEGDRVPIERIDAVELRNSIGDVLNFAGYQTQWLQAIDILGRDFGLDPVELVYSVQSVMVDGSNVVNRGQQRFVVRPSEAPQIELLLYPVSISSHDAVFGYPIGRSVLIRYPDGHQESHNLNEYGELHLNDMARGTYSSVVERAPGLALPTTFVLSRAQNVEVLVISVLDFLTIVLLGIALVAGLIFLGRPELLVRIHARFSRIRDSIGKS